MPDITTNLSHHWTFDGSLTAEVGAVNFAGSVASYSPGAIGQRVNTSAANITAASAATMNFDAAADDFTIATWCRFESAIATVFRFLEKRAGLGAANLGWGFLVTGSNEIAFGMADGINRTRWVGPALTTGTLQHVAFTWTASSSTGALYVDGQAVSVTELFDAPSTLDDTSNAIDTSLGGSGSLLPGYDDTRIYKGRALPSDDVAALFALAAAETPAPSRIVFGRDIARLPNGHWVNRQNLYNAYRNRGGR